MPGYVLSAAARRDITGIWAYTAEQWSARQADRYVRALTAAFEALASGEQDGQSAEFVRAGYRKLVVGAHVIFFRRIEASPVEVIRILHRQMDWPSHLA